MKKYLILDLDETLIYSHVDENEEYDHCIEVYIDNKLCKFYIKERPYLKQFIKQVRQWYKIIIFTASISNYADKIIDKIDHTIELRYYRQHCKGIYYIKDLSILKIDLSKCILVDNSEYSYSSNQENAYPILPWNGDKNDRELLSLLYFLDSIKYLNDFRNILNLRLNPILF